jgi:hypothetical protein
MVCGVFVLAVSGLVLAEEFQGSITKVDGDKVTVQKMKKGKADGDPVVLTAAKDCKILKGKFNKDTKKVEPGDAIEGGLKNEMFSKLPLNARVTAEGTTCSELVVTAAKKKKE